jgi:hypothetical protein
MLFLPHRHRSPRHFSRALAAFTAMKEALANASLLAYPTADAPTCLMTDASDTAVGAVLQQYVDDPISFHSKKTTPAETRYSTFDRELLAVYLAIRHFRHLLEGRHFHFDSTWDPISMKMTPVEKRYSSFDTGRPTLSCAYRPQASDVRTQYSLRSTFSPSGPSAGLHFSIHLHHPPHTRVGQRGS